MPALPSVPRAIRVVLNQALTGVARPIINSFHYGYATGDISAADLLTWTTAIASRWATDLSPIFSLALTLNEVTSTSLSSPTAPTAVAISGATGSTALPSVPAGVAMVEQRKVTRRYRGGHSRIYYAGVSESQLADPDNWHSTYIAAAETALFNFRSHLESDFPSGYGIAAPINISYYEGFTNFLESSGRYRSIPTLRVTPLVDQIVPGGPFVNPKPCSQRRRNGQSS